MVIIQIPFNMTDITGQFSVKLSKKNIQAMQSGTNSFRFTSWNMKTMSPILFSILKKKKKIQMSGSSGVLTQCLVL